MIIMPYSFTIWANDSSDNWNSSSGTFVIQANYGTITGKVVDEDGGGISGVTVELVDANDNLIESMTTNETGDYQFDNITPGTYTIRASKSGFETASVPGINVVAGETTTVDPISLSPEKSFLDEIWWILIIIVVVVVLVIVMLILLMRRRKKPEVVEERVEEEVVSPPMEEAPIEGEEISEEMVESPEEVVEEETQVNRE
jgi:ABC-type sugar transport system permease subunit